MHVGNGRIRIVSLVCADGWINFYLSLYRRTRWFIVRQPVDEWKCGRKPERNERHTSHAGERFADFSSYQGNKRFVFRYVFVAARSVYQCKFATSRIVLIRHALALCNALRIFGSEWSSLILLVIVPCDAVCRRFTIRPAQTQRFPDINW